MPTRELMYHRWLRHLQFHPCSSNIQIFTLAFIYILAKPKVKQSHKIKISYLQIVYATAQSTDFRSLCRQKTPRLAKKSCHLWASFLMKIGKKVSSKLVELKCCRLLQLFFLLFNVAQLLAETTRPIDTPPYTSSLLSPLLFLLFHLILLSPISLSSLLLFPPLSPL